MRCFPVGSWNKMLSAVVALACFGLASCGTTCVAGIFANGNGVLVVKSSTPPPACGVSAGMGMIKVTANKSEVCESCTASSRPGHIFVTLSRIQLRSVFPDAANHPQWVDLAPRLLLEPRQIDLLCDSATEILVQSAAVPAGKYDELRLEFLPDTPADADGLPAENSCGPNRGNCMLMADGRVEELRFTGDGDTPELLLPLQYNGSGAVAVVPGATVDLQFTLQPQPVSGVSPSEGWRIHYVLGGSASVSR